MKETIALYAVVVGDLLLLGLLLYQHSMDIGRLVAHEQPIDVGCDSDSMGLVIDCLNRHYVKEVAGESDMVLGQIYVFNRSEDNTPTMHRYVLDCTDGCFGYIFKGDNNYIADDPVPSDKIRYHLVEVRYE